jgi:Outer membrane protein beta-barrel domain
LRSRNITRVVSSLVAAAAGLLTFGVASEAKALPLITFSASARGLYGSAVGDQELNPYGLGLGLRAGVTLPMSLYLGASFDYFAGETQTVANFDNSAAIYQLMANVGYDVGFGPLTLRPVLGLGYANTSVEGLEDHSSSDFVLAPAAELIIGLGLLSVGAEVRYNKVFSDVDRDGVVLGVGLGISL